MDRKKDSTMIKRILLYSLIASFFCGVACAGTQVKSKDVTNDVTNFNGNLGPTDVDVQHALETLNDLTFTVGSVNWGNIQGTLANQTDLQTALNAKISGISWGQVTGTLSSQTDLQSALNAKISGVNWGQVGGLLSNQTDLTSVLAGKQATITPGISSQYLRGDFSLATFPTNLSSFTNGPGYITGITWGGITGTLTNQTDLSTALNSKQANLNLTPGTYTNGKLCSYTLSGTVLNCTTDAGTGTVTSIATTSPITGGTITSTGTIGISQSTTSTNGYLSSTDWNTFNGKQSALSFANSIQNTAGTVNLVGDSTSPGNNLCYSTNGSGTKGWNACSNGSGTVTSVSVVTANGISGSVATATTTPAITLTPFLKTSGINWTDFPASGFAKWNGSSAPTADTNTYYKSGDSATFAGINITGLTASKPVATDASKNLVSGNYSGTTTTVATTLGTLTNGHYAGFDANGNVVDLGTGGVGVSSVTGTAPITSTGGTTPAIGINWTNFNAIGQVNMGGINWNDARNLNQGVNWSNVDLTTKTSATTGVGAGVIQLWNSLKTQYINWTSNSGLSTNYQIQWPANAPTAGQIPEVMDSLGNINWVALSSGGASNWSQLQGNPNAINWSTFPNSFSGNQGINWSNMINYTTGINWGGTITAPKVVANGTGNAVDAMGVCTSHTGVMMCVGTNGCAGYVTAFTSFNSLTCVCC